MTDDSAAIVRAVHDAWDGALRLVHITVSDEDGDGYPAPDVDRWAIDVRVPLGDDPDEAVSVAAVTAFTVLSPDGLDDFTAAFDSSGVAGGYRSAVALRDPDGGSFPELFGSASALTGSSDLLVIDRVVVGGPYRDIDALVDSIVAAVEDGPAGRNAAISVVDTSVWNVPFDTSANDYTQWADSLVSARMTSDPDELADLAQEALAGRIAAAGVLPVGTRTKEAWLGPVIDEALQQPSIPVPFALPPKLPAHLWAAAPTDIHGVDADETTGSIVIETHDETLEVVGLPGNAPQLVGVAADAPADVQAWLRAVHERWWEYEPDLHTRIHEVLDDLADGTLQAVVDDSTPHLHVPVIDRSSIAPEAPVGMTLEPLSEDSEPQVFTALFEGDDIGAVLVHDDGHVRAFLHDEWQPRLPDHERIVQGMLGLGADEHIHAVIHGVLDDAVTAAILTGDVDGH